MKYRYRSDEEMKDSGVEWIGKIPKDWEVSRIDKEFKVRNEKVSDKKFEPLSVTKQGILPQIESVAKTDNGDNRKKVCIGDFVINSRADRKGSCGVSDYNGSVSLICNVLTPKELNSRYIHNLFRNYYFSEEFYRWGSGIVDDLWSTNIERMKKINIPIPIEKEQNKIAKFLDEKTSDFDNIISKKEKLIEKLEEAKKSLISEVVTGKFKVVKNGEDLEIVKRNDSDMKDSGVEWLGRIPKDWITSKIKYECDINARIGWKALTASEYVDEGYIFLATPNIKGRNIDFKNVNYITKERYYESPEIMLKENDVLLTKDGSTLGTVNVVRELEREATVNGSIAVLRTKEKLEGIFLNYFIKSNYIQNRIKFFKDGMGVPHLFQSDIKQFDLTVPPYEEEILIGKYLDLKIDKIDSIIDKFKLQIEKLKEAKQALISEAVTGKIEILD